MLHLDSGVENQNCNFVKEVLPGKLARLLSKQQRRHRTDLNDLIQLLDRVCGRHHRR